MGLSGSTGSSGVFDPRLFVARSMRLQFTENGRPAIAVATHEVRIRSVSSLVWVASRSLPVLLPLVLVCS